jgi:hypothetical protein
MTVEQGIVADRQVGNSVGKAVTEIVEIALADSRF